jgi:hypothetical protein
MILTEATLNDVSDRSELLVRLSYSAAFCRFVNSIVDPVAEASRDKTSVQIAETVGLPLQFVEIRNIATHEKLPCLADLRYWSNAALEWLWAKFWSVSIGQDQSGQWRYAEELEDSSGLGATSGIKMSEKLEASIRSLAARLDGSGAKDNAKARRKQQLESRNLDQRWRSIVLLADGSQEHAIPRVSAPKGLV